MLATLLVPLSVVLANFAALATQILVPQFLSPGQYADFATLWATGQFVSVLAFEWMRFCVIRYSVGADEAAMKIRRATLMRFYLGVTLILMAISLVAVFVAPQIHLFWSVAAVSIYAICQGTFEGRQALARAEFANTIFSMSWLLRTFLSLILVVLLAYTTGSGTMALIGLALSYPITLLLFGWKSTPRIFSSVKSANHSEVGFLIRYGVFAAASTTISSFLPAAVRAFANSTLPDQEAGGMMLALDLAQKAILVLGVAINIVMVQQSIRSMEFGSEAEQREKIYRQLAVPLALLMPAVVGFALVQDSFVEIAVPASYRAVYMDNVIWGVLASGLLAFRLYAIDPLFLITGKSHLSIWGPILSVVGTFAYLLVGQEMGYSSEIVAQATAFGLGAGLIGAIVAASFSQKIVWPIREFAAVASASAVMALAVTVVRLDNHILQLVARIAMGGAAYGIAAIALNILGVRHLALKAMRPLGSAFSFALVYVFLLLPGAPDDSA